MSARSTSVAFLKRGDVGRGGEEADAWCNCRNRAAKCTSYFNTRLRLWKSRQSGAATLLRPLKCIGGEEEGARKEENTFKISHDDLH